MTNDYPEAVQAGTVINTAEYAEQREFLATVNELLLSLPQRPVQQALLAQAHGLEPLVDDRAPSDQVESGARKPRRALFEAYDVVTAPIVAPVPARAAPLYAEQCAACHGASGRGDGLADTAFEPAPTDFHDTERARQRSV